VKPTAAQRDNAHDIRNPSSWFRRSRRDVAQDDTVEPVALALFERWRESEVERSQTQRSWEQLDKTQRAEIYDQAGFIQVVLRAIGCVLALGGDSITDAELLDLTQAEVESLAIREHDRWVYRRHKEGWALGSTKDVEHKKSPYLVRWEDLPEHVQDHSRAFVRAIPEVLASAGYTIHRRPQPNRQWDETV